MEKLSVEAVGLLRQSGGYFFRAIAKAEELAAQGGAVALAAMWQAVAVELRAAGNKAMGLGGAQ